MVHLMIVQDVLSDYLMVFPLKSKTANKISNVFLYSYFNTSTLPKYILTTQPALDIRIY